MQVFQRYAVAVVFSLTCFAVPVAVSGAEKAIEPEKTAEVAVPSGEQSKPATAEKKTTAAPVKSKPARATKGALGLQEVSSALQNSFTKEAKDMREQLQRERAGRTAAEVRAQEKRQERRDVAPPKTEMQEEMGRKRRSLIQVDFKDLHDAFRDQPGLRPERERRGGGD